MKQTSAPWRCLRRPNSRSVATISERIPRCWQRIAACVVSMVHLLPLLPLQEWQEWVTDSVARTIRERAPLNRLHAQNLADDRHVHEEVVAGPTDRCLHRLCIQS